MIRSSHAAISSGGRAGSAIPTACEKIMKQAIVDVGLGEDGQNGLKAYIRLRRLREIMVGLQVLQESHEALRGQFRHDPVDDQQVVKGLALLVVGQVSPDKEDQVLNTTRKTILLHSLKHI